MKIRSWLCSFLFVLCGIMGAYTLTLPTFNNVASAVSDDASVWNGEYSSSVSKNDFYVDEGKNEAYIYSAKGFAYFAQSLTMNNASYSNTTVYLETDIDLKERNWAPIGSRNQANSFAAFTGTFDGKNHTIYNLKIDSSSTYTYFDGRSYSYTDTYVGLFASIGQGGSVSNLHLANVNINYGVNNAYVGAIAGQVSNGGWISSVSVNGSISANSAFGVGGVVGTAVGRLSSEPLAQYTPKTFNLEKNEAGRDTYISKVVNRASVSGGTKVGGIAGISNYSVLFEECANYGELSSAQSSGNIYIGGIVGSADDSDTNSYIVVQNAFNMGDLVIDKSNINAGGILGYSATNRSRNYFEIRNAYNAGDFLTNSTGLSNVNVSGIIGSAANPNYFYCYTDSSNEENNSNKYYLYGTFNIGNLIDANNGNELTSATGVTFRDLIYFTTNSSVSIEKGTVLYDYDTANTSGTDLQYASKIAQLDGKISNIDFLENTLLWNKTRDEKGIVDVNSDQNIWAINRNYNESLPYLTFIYDSSFTDKDTETSVEDLWLGEGTIDSPYLIYTAEDLARIADVNNGKSFGDGKEDNPIYFSLQNNIDLSSQAWTPIGINGGSFENSVFDGNNFTISGINCSLQVEYEEAVGLFGTISNSIIRNVKIKDFRYIGSTSTTDPIKATLVGRMQDSYIINCADLTGRSENTIGVVGDERGDFALTNATSYIIYGENNLEGEDNYKANLNLPYENGSFTFVKSGELIEGYLVTLNLKNGTLYDSFADSNIEVHKGNSQFVLTVASDGETSGYGLLDMSSLDPTYLTSLPVDTLNVENNQNNTSNVIIKPGFIISGYTIAGVADDGGLDGEKKFADTGASFSSNVSPNDIFKLVESGVNAYWTEHADIEYTVYTNKFEKTVADKTGTDYLGITGDNVLTISTPYNTYWSIAEFVNSLNAEMELQGTARQGFEISGIFPEFDEEKAEFGGTSLNLSGESGVGFFLNQNEDYFIQWKGTENYTITLNLVDNSSEYKGRFDFKDAILNVDVKFNTDTEIEGMTANQITYNYSNFVEDKLLINFSMEYLDNFDRLLSSSEDIYSFISENIEIVITLKDGFTFDTGLDSEDHETLVQNYFKDSGILNLSTNTDKSYNAVYGQAKLDMNTETGADVSNHTMTISLAEFVGNVSLNVPIIRGNYSFPINVGEGVYFGLTLPETVSNVGWYQVLSPNTERFVDMQDYNLEFNRAVSNSNNFSLGLNMFDNYLISTSAKSQETTFDCFDMTANTSYYTGTDGIGKQLIIYDTENNVYYLFEFTTSVEGEIQYFDQTLYLISASESTKYSVADSYTKLDMIARITLELSGSDNFDRVAGDDFGGIVYNTRPFASVTYYTNANFGLVFSTETNEAQINNHQTGPDGRVNYLYSQNITSGGNTSTQYYKISYYFDNPADGTVNVGGEESIVYNFSYLASYINGTSNLKISQTRTTATFNIHFVDEEGNPLFTSEETKNQAPTIRAQINSIGNYSIVQESVQVDTNNASNIKFTIENNNYYEWVNRGTSDEGVNLAVGSHDSSAYALYFDINIDKTTESGVESVVDGIDNILKERITSSGIETDNSTRKAYSFTLNFNLMYSASGDIIPLAYEYDLTFVLKKVNFKVNVETVFRQRSTASDAEYYNDDVAQISISNTSTAESGQNAFFNYGDTMQVSTNIKVGSDGKPVTQGYEFVGYRIILNTGDSITKQNIEISGNDNSSFEMTIQEFLSKYQNAFETYVAGNEDAYSYTIQAIYQSKMISYEATSSKFLINNYNGNIYDESKNNADVSFSFDSASIFSKMDTVDDSGLSVENANRGQFYYYNSSTTTGGNTLESVKIVYDLKATYATKYAFKGFAIVVSDNYQTNSIVDPNSYASQLFLDGQGGNAFEILSSGIGSEQTYSLSIKGSFIVDYLRTCMADENFVGNNGFVNKTFYILPVMEQKSLIINLTSGYTNFGDSESQIVYNTGADEVENTTTNTVTLKYYYRSNISVDFNADYSRNENQEYTLVVKDADGSELTNYETLALNDYFGYRTGYSANGWLVTDNSARISLSTYRIDNLYFSSRYAMKETSANAGLADFEITINKNWQANNYTVIYSSGDGRVNSNIFGNSTGSIDNKVASYDTAFNIAENPYQIVGYEFAGWNTEVNGSGTAYTAGQEVKNLRTGANESDIISEPNAGRTIYLYAQWTAKQYQIKLVANGGEFSDGVTELFVGPITYNTEITGLDATPTRAGFEFDGYYVFVDGEKLSANQVENGDLLRNSIATFQDSVYENEQSEPCLVLYATWRFAGTSSLYYNSQISKTYIGLGKQIEINLSELSAENFVDETGNLVVTNDEDGFKISSNFDYVDVSYEFSGLDGNVTVDESNNIFVPSAVGTYYLNLRVILADAYTFEDFNGVYNLGDNIYETSLLITINVTKADVAYRENDNSIRLANIRYLVSLTEESIMVNTFNGFDDFNELLSYIQKTDVSASDITIDQAYEYLFMKYFNMVNATPSSFRDYRNWTYDTYLEYYGGTNYFNGDDQLEEIVDDGSLGQDTVNRRVTRKNILQNTMFLASYDYQNKVNSITLYAENGVYRYNKNQITLYSLETSESIQDELQINEIVVTSNNTISPNTSYQVKAYLTSINGAAVNYNLYSDNHGNFVYLDNAYILVQVLRLKNNAELSKQSTFFNSTLQNVDVTWVSEEQAEQVYTNADNSNFYPIEVDSNLYVNVEIETSNAGSKDVDTVFKFYDTNNYFNLSNYQIYLKSGEFYLNYSTYFNLILDETFTYTIYNIVNTSQINFATSLLTKEEGYVVNSEIDEELISGLFNVTGFTYSISGNEKTVEVSEDGKYFSTEEEGSILLLDITGNNTASPVVFSGGAVKSINFQIASKNLDTYTRLYHVGTDIIFELNDEHNDNVLNTIDLSGFEFVDGEINEITYYANYSDLVRVDYDMNLPVEVDPYSSYLQLGVDKEDAIIEVTQTNLALSKLMYVKPNNEEIEYQNIFTGPDGVYVGYLEGNMYAPVQLKAYWTIADLEVSNYGVVVNNSVGLVDEVYADEVGSLISEENELFNYKYEMLKDGVVVSSSSSFETLKVTFENGGTLKDNGNYIVRITTTIKDEYAYILDSASEKSVVNENIAFSVQLMPIRITAVGFVGQNEITYDGLDHKLEFQISVSYQMFDANILDYSDEVLTQNYQYGQLEMLKIGIFKDDEEQTLLMNAGNYIIQISPDVNFYVLADNLTQDNLKFNYLINKYEIKLDEKNIQLGKQFNTEDGELVFTFVEANETITLNLTRDAGEAVGSYGLYLETFTSKNNENFIVKYEEVTLYENGSYSNLDTRIGTFTISSAGNLRIYWDVTEIYPKNFEVAYDKNGYSAYISNGQLIIKNGENNVASLTLALYDINANERITSQDLLDVVIPLLNDVKVYLFNTSNLEIAYNAAVYSFETEIPENAEIKNYFQNVVFSSDYTLQIISQTIDVEEFDFSKTFDGTSEAVFDIDGNLVDLTTFSGVYISVNYADIHASDNVSATLALASNSSEQASNYALSNTRVVTRINKRKANITFSLSQNSFTYGQLNVSNLKDYVSYTVQGEGGENLTELFNTYSLYNLAFDLDNVTNKISSQGYYYAGTYSLVSTSTYQDFDMTENLGEVVISPYKYSITLPESYIVITVLDDVESVYTENRILEETGDNFEVSYRPVDAVKGNIGKYDLELVNSLYFDGNVEVSINTPNNAFEITEATNTLYLELENPEILEQVYNAKVYTMTTSAEEFTVTVENEDVGFETVSSKFKFYYYDEAGEKQYLENGEFSNIEIYYNENITTFKDVGNYKLTLNAESDLYEKVAFAENYYFVISGKVIDVSTLTFTKVYDGNNYVVVNNIPDVIAGDDVSVRAIYSSMNAGDSIGVSLYLNGESAKNYVLSSNMSVGSITKRDATISLTQDSLMYGTVLKDTSSFSFTVTADGEAVAVNQYVITATVKDGVYNGNYLTKGDYALTLNVESQNYNITSSGEIILHIVPNELSFTISTDGLYMTSSGTTESKSNTFTRSYLTSYGDTINIEYTREPGSTVGYYRILSGKVLDNENYTVKNVTDESANGGFRIVISNDVLYLLASEDAEITTQEEGNILNLTYDGNNYDKVAINLTSDGYELVLSNSTDESIKQTYKLNLYSYDEGTGTYTLTDIQDNSIIANAYLDATNPIVKDVGNYIIYSGEVTSDNFTIRLGKANSLYSYMVRVSPCTLYFNTSTISKIFDNNEAVITFSSAKEVLNGFIGSDDATLKVTFYDSDDNVAVYAGSGYRIEAELSGNNNYVVELTMQDGSEVTGTIDKAPLIVNVNNATAIYGNPYNLTYTFTSETLDLNAYDTSKINFSLSVLSPIYTTSNNLKVGEYRLNYEFNSNDFYIYMFNCNNILQENLNSTLQITPRELTIQETDTALSEIFTKQFDNSADAEIFDEGGQLLFGLSNVMAGDDVTVLSGTYAQKEVGILIKVAFTLGGTDFENYTVKTYDFGQINSVIINLTFDYVAGDDEVVSNVDLAGLKTISMLSYPFISNNYITENSASEDTNKSRNFPTVLTGKTGNTFSHWVLELSATESSPEYIFLDNLLNDIGNEYTYENGVFSITVGNNAITVSLINNLVSDENDYFGVSYFAHEDINFTFKAVWIGDVYQVSVKTQNANGELSTEFAQVMVNNKEMATASEIQSVNFGDQVVINVTTNPYVKLLGFFNELNDEIYVDGEGCTIEQAGNLTTITFDNMQSSIFVVIKFSYADVAITLDLSTFTDEITFNDPNFVPIGSKIYTWKTDYSAIKNLYVSDLPTLSRTGFTVSNYTFNGLQIVNASDFASRQLQEFLVGAENGNYEITYIPAFVGKQVDVTLDYGYDGITEIIQVPYQGKFADSTGWKETIERVGYDFNGWFNGEQQVTGEDQLMDETGLTLFAHWTAQKNTVDLTIENMTITYASSTYLEQDGHYIFSDLDYGTTLTISLTPDEGYEVDSIKYTHIDTEEKDVSFNTSAEGVATLTFDILEPPTIYMTASSKAKTNTVEVLGDHIDSFTAYKNGNEEIQVSGNSFEVETNVDIRLVVNIMEGFDFTDFVISDRDVVSNYSLSGNELTINLSNINKSFSVTINAVERTNKVHLSFDDTSLVDALVVDNQNVNSYDFDVLTGQILTIYAKLVVGYSVDTVTSTSYSTSLNEITDTSSPYFGYYEIVVDGINRDGTVEITTKRTVYTLKVETIVYGDNQEIVQDSNNKAFVNGQSEVSLEYLTNVSLTAEAETLYSFAGWSKDGEEVFSTENPLSYEITQNETIYAIFSKLEFTINLNSYNHYFLYTEYNDADRTQEVYDQIYTAPFYEEDMETQISAVKLFYGASKTIYLEVPTGYIYEGFGYIRADGTYEYILRENSADKMIEIYLSTFDFEVENSTVNLFVALSALEANIKVSSWIDFDGTYEEDDNVGDISLVSVLGESVNRYGYVDGTRNHYDSNSFIQGSGLVDSRNMTIISYTSDTIYLKIKSTRPGYFFSTLTVDNSSVMVSVKDVVNEEDGTYYIYQISNFVGGGNDLNVSVYFKPQKNITTINFINENGSVVDGGNLHIQVESEYSGKIWADGTNFSSMKVTGFTDTKFSVVAYIRLGFMIDEENIAITFNDALVKVDNIRFEKLMFEKTNYNYAIYFDVYDYADDTTISINVIPQTYSVILRDETLENPELVRIDNVKFHEAIDLSIANQGNITIYDEFMGFNETGLNVVQSRDNYAFGGYFTYAGGKGIQYINSSGLTLIDFMETGYEFDEQEQIYKLTDNAYIETDGTIVINLYLYWSYLKTQINFEIVPNISTGSTALDIVQGVDLTNSWYNDVSPLYIEVAFNTNINFVAPEIAGYKFYKFVIKQKDINNNWLTDVVSYSTSVPWSTNEYDRIVEVHVQLVYFAKVDVQLYGGELEFEITQTADDNTARNLIREGYVDTTKDFTLTALESSGYDFVYWQNIATGQRYTSSSFTTRINERTIFLLYAQGKEVNLLFDEYDATDGQIVMLQTRTQTGNMSTQILGSFINGSFVKVLNRVTLHVGDTVTFVMNINFGYGVEFNLEDVELTQMTSQYYYFTMKLGESLANQSLQVIPTFVGESVAFYVEQIFGEDEIISNAIDGNNADYAGYTSYNDEITDVITDSIHTEINIKVNVTARYRVVSIKAISNNGTILDITSCYNDIDSILSLSPNYMAENNIAGTLQLQIEYERLYYGDSIIEESGSGTEDDPYTISTADELAYYMTRINNGAVNNNGLRYAEANYIIMADISLGEKFWTPIGTYENPFNGTFNFNSHRIDTIGLAVIYDQTSYGGLFGVLGENATIYMSITNYWYIYIIIAIVLLLIILLIILLLVNKKRKKRREELNVK